MRIGIIGFGYVGSAIAWAHRSHDVVIRDPKLEDSAELSAFTTCDAIYICVPSPSTEDGHCDSSILEQTLKELTFVAIQNPSCVFICKTTAPPSIYQTLATQYPNIVYCPEFLTAKNNITDYLKTKYVILGGSYDWAVKARSCIRVSLNLGDEDIIIVDIKTASMFKYMMNSYLALKVTFMNDFHRLAVEEGVNWHDLKFLSRYDKRIGETHMDVPGPDGQYGWGGGCFPKDVSAIIMEAIDKNINFELMDRVEAINKKHRKYDDKSV